MNENDDSWKNIFLDAAKLSYNGSIEDDFIEVFNSADDGYAETKNNVKYTVKYDESYFKMFVVAKKS